MCNRPPLKRIHSSFLYCILQFYTKPPPPPPTPRWNFPTGATGAGRAGAGVGTWGIQGQGQAELGLRGQGVLERLPDHSSKNVVSAIAPQLPNLPNELHGRTLGSTLNVANMHTSCIYLAGQR